jgi:hypothetical protein
MARIKGSQRDVVYVVGLTNISLVYERYIREKETDCGGCGVLLFAWSPIKL